MDTDQKRKKSMSVFERALRLSDGDGDSKKRPRLTDLIAEFEAYETDPGKQIQIAKGWHFCVPSSFCPALDIQLTERIVKTTPAAMETQSTGGKTKKQSEMVWTQGSWFHFEAGDTLYDHGGAYRAWSLSNFDICLDIKKSTAAVPANKTKETNRYPGTVIFDVLTPNCQRTELIRQRQTVMTQDEFVRMLILGPPEDWQQFLLSST